MTDPVILGIRGTVLALDRASGAEVWRTSLKGADFVHVVRDDNALYAATKGEIFCLDPGTGVIRWHNKLRGLGLGLVSIAGAAAGGTVLFGEKKRRDAAAAAG